MTTSDISAFFSRLVNRSVLLVTDPYGFFEQVKAEPGMGEAFRVFAILSGFSAIMALLMNRVLLTPTTIEYFLKSTGVSFPFQFQSPNFAGQFVLLIIGYAFGLGLVFVGAAILHAWSKIWGGNASFADSFRLHVYRKIPVFLVGWVPVIGGVIGIYGLILTIIGVQKIHGISRRRAIIMFLLPYLFFFVLALLAVAFAGYIFIRMQQMH